MKAKLIVLAAAVLATGCAKNPSAIAANPVIGAPYAGLSCSQIASTRADSELALKDLSAKQSRMRAGDTFGVLLIGVPVSSAVSEDYEMQIANEKGKIQSLQTEAHRKNCAS